MQGDHRHCCFLSDVSSLLGSSVCDDVCQGTVISAQVPAWWCLPPKTKHFLDTLTMRQRVVPGACSQCHLPKNTSPHVMILPSRGLILPGIRREKEIMSYAGCMDVL